jgi:hypothetical protein
MAQKLALGVVWLRKRKAEILAQRRLALALTPLP